jgi:hypothetical protein
VREEATQARHLSEALLNGLEIVERREHRTGVAEQLRGQL